LLKAELLDFRRMKGYIPSTIVVHMSPLLENDITAEIAGVARDLGVSITPAKEGMEVLL
jgi:histidinol dehydrogenase